MIRGNPASRGAPKHRQRCLSVGLRGKDICICIKRTVHARSSRGQPRSREHPPAGPRWYAFSPPPLSCDSHARRAGQPRVKHQAAGSHLPCVISRPRGGRRAEPAARAMRDDVRSFSPWAGLSLQSANGSRFAGGHSPPSGLGGRVAAAKEATEPVHRPGEGARRPSRLVGSGSGSGCRARFGFGPRFGLGYD